MSNAPGRRFKPGQSGNPKGRPPGVGHNAKLRAAIEADLPEIIAAMVARAKSGDTNAARVLLERVMPPVRASEQPVPIQLPEGAGLADVGRAVLSSAAAGELAPGQAAQLLTGLGALARLVETDELAARLAALEARDAG